MSASPTSGGALVPASTDGPFNPHLTPLLNDFYQMTMVYGYWMTGRHEENAVFDLFFRKNPFKGEFTVFGGLEEVLRLLQAFRFTDADIEYLRTQIPVAPDAFWEYLRALDCSKIKLYAIAEGSTVFPRVPCIRVEGPLGVAQLLETPLLNTCNFASLITTNAARHRLVAGADKTLLEFGVRRAQGPDGAMSASRYSFMGGFDGTSNVAAGLHFGMPIMGTHAHSFVSSFANTEELPVRCRVVNGVNLLERALWYRSELGHNMAVEGELAAFIAYAFAFPTKFLALVDTYETLSSGVPNYIAVSLALIEAGLEPVGIRLDSGDLAYLSRESRRLMKEADARFGSSIAKMTKIVASNDINEVVLNALNDQGHDIDTFGIGTNLVTCQAQPALGMVYKLVELNGMPRIKLSQDSAKITIPGRKEVYRLIGVEGVPLVDLILRAGEARPIPGRRILCRHPFDDKKRAYVTPSAVVPLLRLVWKGRGADLGMEDGEVALTPAGGAGEEPLPGSVNLRAPEVPLADRKAFVTAQLALLREDHIRHINPTPYKVSVSAEIWSLVHTLLETLPVADLK